MGTFTKQQWKDAAEYFILEKLSNLDEDDFQDLLESLWDTMPTGFNRKVMEILETNWGCVKERSSEVS